MKDEQILDPQSKTIVDIFSKQYDQFFASMDKWQESNDKAHDKLFTKVDNITNDVHDIRSNVNVIINNQNRHQKEVEDLKENVSKIDDRLTVLEDDKKGKAFFKHRSVFFLTIAGTAVGIALSIWKILEVIGIL